MEIFSLPPEKLVQFIDRIRKFDVDRYEAYLHTLFLNVLSELAEFVPSEGIMVLIDNPVQKREGRPEKELTYVTALGKNAASLIGKKTLATAGVIGESYTLGKSTVRKTEVNERIVIDKVNFPHEMNNLICVPLKIQSTVIGVLLLFNKKDPVGFTIRDLKLVEIFGGYISTSLQNAIDARKSKELSKRDDLTGLYNDRHFHAQLETEVLRAQERRSPLSLIFMDLDQFKRVNDQHGHLVGSQTLKEVAFILHEAVAFDQATIARYGGDEYVVILPGIDTERALDIAERIRKTIADKLFMIYSADREGSFISFKGLISASLGISCLDHLSFDGTLKERKDHLIRLADTAMYRAKEGGKNCVCVADPSQTKPKGAG